MSQFRARNHVSDARIRKADVALLPELRSRVGEPYIVGWKESVSLPDLGIETLPVKVDTGARTSALHVLSAEAFTDDKGESRVRFEADLTPAGRRTYEAPAAEVRIVRSSNGQIEERLAIRTILQMGAMRRRVEITLTNRDDMRFPMLVGRTALRRGVLIDPDRSFLVSERIEPAGALDADDADNPPGEDSEA